MCGCRANGPKLKAVGVWIFGNYRFAVWKGTFTVPRANHRSKTFYSFYESMYKLNRSRMGPLKFDTGWITTLISPLTPITDPGIVPCTAFQEPVGVKSHPCASVVDRGSHRYSFARMCSDTNWFALDLNTSPWWRMFEIQGEFYSRCKDLGRTLT